MTIFNRKEKTLACLESIYKGISSDPDIDFELWITDDGSTDNSSEAIKSTFPTETIRFIQGDGNLFWNGGMIAAWEAAISHGGYDGYLWLNNDVIVLDNVWRELKEADKYSVSEYGRRGIYVGSLQDMDQTRFTYGGFIFVNKFTLKDEYVIPNGAFQTCECAHGNITYVSSEVVESQGIFCKDYIHGGTDHDYSYLAHKAGFPLIVLREYVGLCDNDHKGSNVILADLKLSDRIAFLKSPHGLNLHNTLLFQKRCFPWRLPFAWVTGYAKAIFPGITYKLRSIIN